jgi:hypothetical protein
MLNQKAHWEELFARKFRPVFREIEYIKNKIHLKEGFFIFKSHIYSVNELLESEHHAKINSIAEKIGDDFMNWDKRGEISVKGKKIYVDKRFETEEELHRLNLEIQTRQRTWWEETSQALIMFVKVVMKKLPIPVLTFLVGKIGDVLGIPLIGIVARLFLPEARKQ